MNNNPELKNILQSFPGIEDSTSTIRLSSTPIAVDGKFCEIKKSTVVGPNGIADKMQIVFRCFDCCCIADREGRNFGTICYSHLGKLPEQVKRRDIIAGLSGKGRPLYICKKHALICPSCKKRIICIHCWKLRKGIPYCGMCFMLMYFGLKKEVRLCSNPIRKNRLSMR